MNFGSVCLLLKSVSPLPLASAVAGPKSQLNVKLVLVSQSQHQFSLFVCHFLCMFPLCQCHQTQAFFLRFCSNPSSHQPQPDWQSTGEEGLSKLSKKSTYRAVSKTECFPGNMENLVYLMTCSMYRFPQPREVQGTVWKQ